jgi:hypothetical protein
MKIGHTSGSRNQRRRRNARITPAAAELLETRSLLSAGPVVNTPMGTVTTDQPVISWDAVDNATSYDLWVSDMDSREVLFVEEGIGTTNFTPTTGLNQGRIRVWVRAQLADSSYTDWGPNHDFIVQVTPTVTGPVNSQLPSTPTLINDTTPTITWESAPGNWRFQVFLSNQTALTSTQYTVQNLTPILDENGDPIPDGEGDVLREEIRSFEIPTELSMAEFQVFVRAIDDGGRVTDWSPAYHFTVAPQTEVLRPFGPSFDDPPLLEWDAVPGATNYDVWVTTQTDYDEWVDGGMVGPLSELYRVKYNEGNSYQIPKKLDDGEYVFWVQAINMTAGRPLVRGIWSEAAHFATIRKPIVNGPVGVETNDPTVVTVTDARPVITWTPIDKAARYDVWVDRTQGPAQYVLDTSSVASYQFKDTIDPGNYWVWVRALSPKGEPTPWSDPYIFTATGGAPVITFPADNSNTVPLPTFTWTPVGEADTYEIWVALVGVDFDFLQVSGIAQEEYTPANPFNPGTYRLWVRAIGEDSTEYRWSESVTFVVAEAETPTATDGDSSPLVALQPAIESPRSTPDSQPVRQPAEPAREDVEIAEQHTVMAQAAETGESGHETESLPHQVIAKIAAEGRLTEWWADDAESV